jgi:hypothetical protein
VGVIPGRSIMPKMGPAAYKTFSMSRPLTTHFRPATCDEIRCEAYRCGWVTTVDLSDDLGRRRYDFITHDATRKGTEQRVSPTLVKFVFAPGQRCYQAGEHRLPTGRPFRYLVSEGDWRGNPRGIPPRVHAHAGSWVDEFSEHNDRLATAIKRG